MIADSLEAERDRLAAANERQAQLLERLAGALDRIAAGPNDAPFSEPWSKAEAMIALRSR